MSRDRTVSDVAGYGWATGVRLLAEAETFLLATRLRPTLGTASFIADFADQYLWNFCTFRPTSHYAPLAPPVIMPPPETVVP